jgi:hypothetical protein
VVSLGDPATANRAYRKVLVTSSEASILRQTRCGFASRSRRRIWLLPSLALLASVWFFVSGDNYLGWTLLTGTIGLALLAGAFWLPVYTPMRGRIFRTLRLLWLGTLLALTMKDSWLLLVSCAWPLMWLEWKHTVLRRKLPVSQWPKQLYL